MDIQIFDNFEDDGQLTLFGLEEDYEELRTSVRGTTEETAVKEPAVKEPMQGKMATGTEEQHTKRLLSGEQISGEQPSGQADEGIRIRSCSSCGKLLFVREEDGGYVSACNACGIQYIQK